LDMARTHRTTARGAGLCAWLIAAGEVTALTGHIAPAFHPVLPTLAIGDVARRCSSSAMMSPTRMLQSRQTKLRDEGSDRPSAQQSSGFGTPTPLRETRERACCGGLPRTANVPGRLVHASMWRRPDVIRQRVPSPHSVRTSPARSCTPQGSRTGHRESRLST
jgi:hypothetical protein